MQQQPNRWWKIIKTTATMVLALGALVAFLAWMGGAFHTKVVPGHVELERPTAQGRTLVPVLRERSDNPLIVVGSVQPRRKTEVASQLLATILEVKGRPGERVKVGDELVILDARELLTQQREFIAASRAAEADLVVRKNDVERARAGVGTGAVTREDYDRLKGAVQVGEAQVERVKEQINRLEVQLSHTKIRATSSGIIADRTAEPGDLAQPGKPLLVIHDPTDLEFHAAVPESQMSGILLGKKVTVDVEAANRYHAETTIREIVPQAQQASRTVLVKAALPVGSSTTLLAGMFGRLRLSIGERESLMVPQTAVLQLGQLELVEVVGSDQKLSRRFVRTGRIDAGKVELLSGVSEGEQLALPARP